MLIVEGKTTLIPRNSSRDDAGLILGEVKKLEEIEARIRRGVDVHLVSMPK
jgi:hypothetical protein